MTEDQSTKLQRLLYAFAFLLLACRYLWPGDTVYILDEAFIQLRIDEHFAAGTIPLSNSRGSSIPLPYGPGGLWFYMFLRFFVWHPIPLALCHITLQALGYLVFVRAIHKSYGPEAGAWTSLLAASSPLLFFFGRHTWDNTLLIPLASLLFFLVSKLRENGPSTRLYLAMGLISGYALNIHLMFGAVFLALSLTLFLSGLKKHGVKSGKLWVPLAVFGGTSLIVLLPYLFELVRIASEEKPFAHARVKEHWGDGRNLWWLFQRSALFSSLFGARVQFFELRDELLSYAGSPLAFFFRVDLFGWFGKIAAWSGAIFVLARLAGRRVAEDPLRLFGALSFFFTLLVYQYLNIPTAPHYFNPMWWFVFAGVAVAIRGLRSFWKTAFLVSLACTIIVNTSYIAVAMAFIHQNKGARTMETSVVVSEQLRNLRELCGWASKKNKKQVNIFKEAHVGEPTFDFLPAHMPECAGVKVVLVGNKTEADFVLHHPTDSSTSAALVADPALKP